MAKAIPVHSAPEVEEATTVAVEATDPRRPNPEAEHAGDKPKTVTKLDNGTVIEDY